ncbi:hypothetical protein RZS28_14835 [Methylocapsa polymorpha]|uniref:Uncharacterized protein n=1 Tax=Methylocapsa polymorpha TaxID=3080828 RepID=A0ABZ0HPG7_9HYPH|nr:hypothetical protein RZS28_14835 [Methylocapsa sp. RX1]
MDLIRQWLSSLGPIVTLIGLCLVYKQIKIATHTYEQSTEKFKEEQKWKKAEFIANQAKDFYTDKRVERVIYMLDWGADGRELLIENFGQGPILILHDEAERTRLARDNLRFQKVYFKTMRFVILENALRWHEVPPELRDLEIYIRQEFDWFLFKLELFEHMIKSKVFSYEEIEAHLSYVLDLVSNGKEHVGIGLRDAIANYIDKYDFPLATSIINRRKTSRNRQIASLP